MEELQKVFSNPDILSLTLSFPSLKERQKTFYRLTDSTDTYSRYMQLHEKLPQGKTCLSLSIADTLFSAHLFIPILQSTVTTFISLLSKFCTSLHLRHLELALTIPARQQGLFWKKESNSLNNHCQVPSFRRELNLSGGWSWVQIPARPPTRGTSVWMLALRCSLYLNLHSLFLRDAKMEKKPFCMLARAGGSLVKWCCYGRLEVNLHVPDFHS